MLLASRGLRAEMLLNIVAGIGKFSTTKNYSLQMAIVLRLRTLAEVKVMLGVFEG